MRLEIEIDSSDIVYKESGEIPEEFTPYAFIWEPDKGEYDVLVGFYDPDYKDNQCGVWNGIGGHLDWSKVIAWKCLEEMRVVSREDI